MSRKSADIMTAHSGYQGSVTRGGARTREVVADFGRDPERMNSEAQWVREYIAGDEWSMPQPSTGSGEPVVQEGSSMERVLKARERDSKIRGMMIDAVSAKGGQIVCEACGFDFGKVYGGRGEGYIDVHYRARVQASGPTETTLADLSLPCANCHRMTHRRTQWLTVEWLKEIITMQHNIDRGGNEGDLR